MKRPDLLVLVAIWEFITAFGALIAAGFVALILSSIYPGIRVAWGFALGTFIVSIIVLVLLTYVAMASAGGIGLLQGREWGRILTIITAIIALIRVPFGTVIGALVLIYLLQPDTRAYFTPHMSRA